MPERDYYSSRDPSRLHDPQYDRYEEGSRSHPDHHRPRRTHSHQSSRPSHIRETLHHPNPPDTPPSRHKGPVEKWSGRLSYAAEFASVLPGLGETVKTLSKVAHVGGKILHKATKIKNSEDWKRSKSRVHTPELEEFSDEDGYDTDRGYPRDTGYTATPETRYYKDDDNSDQDYLLGREKRHTTSSRHNQHSRPPERRHTTGELSQLNNPTYEEIDDLLPQKYAKLPPPPSGNKYNQTIVQEWNDRTKQGVHQHRDPNTTAPQQQRDNYYYSEEEIYDISDEEKYLGGIISRSHQGTLRLPPPPIGSEYNQTIVQEWDYGTKQDVHQHRDPNTTAPQQQRDKPRYYYSTDTNKYYPI